MKRIFTTFLATSLLATTAGAQFVQSPAYKECTELATSHPDQALQKSAEWLKIDDSFSAHHCRAMALFGLSKFSEAGDELSLVRDKVPVENLAMRTYVARQAVNAWVNAGRTDAALALLATQLNEMSTGKYDNVTESKLSAQLLLDRARLRMKFGQSQQAVQDLDHAVSLTPLNEEVLIARAQAFEQLGDKPLARQDAQAVLRLNPKHPQALELMQRIGDK